MVDQCAPFSLSPTFPVKHWCSVNGREYSAVSTNTIPHHIKALWNRRSKGQGYYFYDDPDCDVIYFGQDGSIIPVSSLRNSVDIKQKSLDATV